MFVKDLVLILLGQIDDALAKIAQRTAPIRSVDDFTDSPAGMEKLDGICMLFMAVGEALKKYRSNPRRRSRVVLPAPQSI
jgi:hypothetical protein